ncbi:ABC transporter substrate-binding protein [Halomonas denitrificans]|uniref:ABC transporter substrate-binding protein n=1 Tax=Halomonas denitrificans TaxID=370769 RepID=UPI0021BD3246|nr:ABC transporter substrate-binding protein [Halomonas denitrificans]
MLRSSRSKEGRTPVLKMLAGAGKASGLLAASLSAAALSTAQAADGRVDVVAPWEVGSIEPTQSGHIFGRMEVGETLVDVALDGELIAGLATDWQVDDSGLEWRFRLRQGVEFHDGSPMTPETVAQSLERTLGEPGVLSQANISQVAVDEDELVLTLDAPYGALPALLSHYSTQILAPSAYDQDGRVVAYVATGPYQVATVETPQRLTTTRFEAYWGEPPSIAEASYLAAPRGETRSLMAQSGDADIVLTLDAASQARLSRAPNVEVMAVPIPRTVLLKLNAARSGLDSPEVRRAVSMAIQREGIARGILRSDDAMANQMMPPGVAGWHLDGLAPLTQDLDEARRLLAEDGWTPGQDGVLTRDGERLALTLTTFSDRPELPLIATALQAQLAEVGIEVTVDVANSSEIPSRHHDGSLDMGLMARNFGLVPDPLPIMLQDYSSGQVGGDWGAMNWSSRTLDELLGEMQAATDGATREALAGQAAEVLHRELPVIPIAWYVQTAAVNAALEGFELDPFDRSYRISELEWAQ